MGKFIFIFILGAALGAVVMAANYKHQQEQPETSASSAFDADLAYCKRYAELRGGNDEVWRAHHLRQCMDGKVKGAK